MDSENSMEIYVCKVEQGEAVNEYSAVSILGGSV
jgi:hypothetical protein